MRLTVLNDNSTVIDNYLLGEPALSFYIEDGNEKMLFDLGYSNVFIKNAYKMNINLNEVNKIIFSHGHDDHTGGIRYIFKHILKCGAVGKTLYLHPNALDKKIDNGVNIGFPYSLKKLEKLFRIITSREPININEKFVFLGEIPQYNNFENRVPIGYKINNGRVSRDYLEDDTAIVYRGKEGLLVITGCSHSGICNIIEYAKEICYTEKVYGVIGGFHLFNDYERITKTVQYLKNNDVKAIYPCHCTSLWAKSKMLTELGNVFEIGVGCQIDVL